MIVETDVGLIELETLSAIRVCRDEITLFFAPSGICLRGEGVHRTLCDMLYGAMPPLTRGPVASIFDGRPVAHIESVTHASPHSAAPGLERPLAWPIPQEFLLLEGEKATWLWPRTLFRQIAYSKRANGTFFLAIGDGYFRIEVNPVERARFEADLRQFYPRSETSLADFDRNAFTVWPKSAYKGPLVRPRFAAKSIEEMPGYDAAVWEDSATEIIRKGPFAAPKPNAGLTMSP
jgi:hypothetical protein